MSPIIGKRSPVGTVPTLGWLQRVNASTDSSVGVEPSQVSPESVSAEWGQDITRQLRELRRGVQVVVGTPGRLLDHIRRGSLDLSGTQYVVLDEADVQAMLDRYGWDRALAPIAGVLQAV